MRKIFVIFVMLCVLVGCQSKDASQFTATSVNKVIDKVNKSQSFLVVITNTNCYSCDEFVVDATPLLEEHNIEIDSIDYSQLSNSEIDQLNIALGSYTTWPAVFYILEGKVYPQSIYEYTKDAEGWEAWLIKMGLIKE